MRKLLSQEEVDSLLKGISDGEVETEQQVDEAASGHKRYDFSSQDRIIRGRMPTMEIINERFAREVTASLYRFTGKMLDTTVESFELIKYGEFIKKLPIPSSLHLFRTDPLRGSSLYFLDAKLIYLIVDMLFGGRGKFRMKIEGRDFSVLEYRVIQRLLDLLLADLEKSWSFLEEIRCRYTRSEVNPQFANIVPQTDIVLANTFLVETEWDRAFMGYCIPYCTIEPIKDRLYGRFQSEYVEVDQTWRHRITGHLLATDAEVSVELGTTELSLRQLLMLGKGDVLNLNTGPNDSMVLKVQDVPKGRCVGGRRHGSYAVEVISIDQTGSKEKTIGAESGRNKHGAGPGGSGLERSLFESSPESWPTGAHGR
jgi:flagellar motor switch protein FliM